MTHPTTPHRRCRPAWLALSLLPLLLPAAALAGPWEVGGTSPGKDTKFAAEVSWKHTDSRDTWVRPALKFGAPLGEDLAWEVSTGYGVVERDSGTTRGGARDASAKLKWRLARETGGRPAWLLEPKFSFATGDAAAGIGSGTTTLKLPLRAGRQFGSLRLTGEVFATHGFAHDYDDMVGYGALLEYAPGERWVLGVDLLNDRPVHDGGRYHLRGNAAFKFRAGRHVELQGLLGRSVENRRGEMATSVKFVAVYRL